MSIVEPFTVAAARSLGLTRSRLRRPEFVRLAHGVVVRLTDAIDEPERLRLLAAVLPADAASSHQTAAALLGAPIDSPPRPHVALTPRRVLPQHAGLFVPGRRLQPADVVEHRSLRLTSGAQTFLDLAAVLPAAELTAVGDALRRLGHLDPERLGQRLTRARSDPRRRPCAPGGSAAQSAGAVPAGEPDALLAAHQRATRPSTSGRGTRPAGPRGGARRPRLQRLEDPGRDEGRQHAEAEQFGRDIDRYTLMAADGWLVLRFARQHLGGPWTVVERTRTALLSRGWRPTTR
jgi:hypothetical protein